MKLISRTTHSVPQNMLTDLVSASADHFQATGKAQTSGDIDSSNSERETIFAAKFISPRRRCEKISAP